MTNYLEQLKSIIINDDFIYIEDINEKNENNLLLNKKRRIKEKEVKHITEENTTISLNEKSKSISKNKSNSKKNINISNEKQSNSNKKSTLTLDNSESDSEEEEENEDDSDEYINSEDENSNSSQEDKKLNKPHKRRKKNKIKQNQNGIISKIYPVRTFQNDVISSGYRVYCRYKGISMCFGPYDDFNFAYDLRKLIHSQLKMFRGDIPDVLDKIKEFLKRTKEAVDKKKAPIKMLKKIKTINN